MPASSQSSTRFLSRSSTSSTRPLQRVTNFLLFNYSRSRRHQFCSSRRFARSIFSTALSIESPKPVQNRPPRSSRRLHKPEQGALGFMGHIRFHGAQLLPAPFPNHTHFSSLQQDFCPPVLSFHWLTDSHGGLKSCNTLAPLVHAWRSWIPFFHGEHYPYQNLISVCS